MWGSSRYTNNLDAFLPSRVRLCQLEVYDNVVSVCLWQPGVNLITFVWGLVVGGGGVNGGTKADQSSAKGHAEE